MHTRYGFISNCFTICFNLIRWIKNWDITEAKESFLSVNNAVPKAEAEEASDPRPRDSQFAHRCGSTF